MSSPFTITKMAKSSALICLPVCLLGCLLIFSPPGQAQDQEVSSPPRGQDQPDVLRVHTQLVQTDVMVFDSQGRFVDGLKSSDFELRIDGKPRAVEFFEKITAGSVNEESQIAAARGSFDRVAGNNPTRPTPLDRGRPIFFYVDDLHMDLSSLTTTRKLISDFLENHLGQNDEAAIASASGQIGFLQQLTDNKSVLRAALERLSVRPYSVRDFERPPMTEYQALLITQRDRDTTDYFVEYLIDENPNMTPENATSLVRNRALVLVQQASYITTNTLAGLEELVRSANKLPGRKLVFFISGGFLLDDRTSDTRYQLQRITSAAARSGVVIYSMDARGLVAGLTDASTESQPDLTGRMLRGGRGELLAMQDGMNALASDTGGKATFNQNSLESGLRRALQGTSTYYLLAWKPEAEAQRASKFRRIEVKVKGRPGLTVQVRRGFFDREPEPAKTKAATAQKSEKNARARPKREIVLSPEAELRKVILAPYPERDIPVSLSLTYMNTPARGPLLSAALQVPNEFFSFLPANGKHTAAVTVAGSVFDHKGSPGATFSNRITIDAASVDAAREGRDLSYGFPVYIGPGLYQVRVGVRDERTGRSGTAHGWIEIPNLSTGQLALSSLLMGLRTQPAMTNASASAEDLTGPVGVSIARNFSANGFLRFLVIVYNAARAPTDSKPDVAIQVHVVRDEQPVVTTALTKVLAEESSDAKQIPYAAEIPLSGLPAGRYVLRVAVVDRVAKKSASQQTRFEIE